jgi:hypothetical protein
MQVFPHGHLQSQSQRKGAIAPCSWTPKESEVESYEQQDNANIHCQPFPESASEEHEIYTDDDGYHRHHVKHDSYLSAHFSLMLPPPSSFSLSGCAYCSVGFGCSLQIAAWRNTAQGLNAANERLIEDALIQDGIEAVDLIRKLCG